jgi:uncharacterized cupredoxin-like copper-binding protein
MTSAITPVLRRIAVPTLFLFSIGLLAAGCGDDSGTTTVETTASDTAASTGGGAAGSAALEIKMDDYAFIPKNGQAKAGKTVITAPNVGAVEHEMVLFRTNMNPAKLPTEADGSVDEEKMDEVAEEGGEIADVEAGKSKSETFDLKPGKYVMFCNLPGHYALGMYGTLTVK